MGISWGSQKRRWGSCGTGRCASAFPLPALHSLSLCSLPIVKAAASACLGPLFTGGPLARAYKHVAAERRRRNSIRSTRWSAT